MKKTILIASLVWGICSACQATALGCGTSACVVDTLPVVQLICYLEQMKVESYYGKPVDSFLLAVPANFYNLSVYGGTHIKW